VTRSHRPRVVIKWLRLPLWFLFAGSALATTFFVADVRTARQERALLDHGYHTTAYIAAGWNGGPSVPLAYENPQTHQVVRTSTYVWNDALRPKRVGTVDIDASRTDPKEVRIAGDRFPAATNVPSYLSYIAIPLAVWLARRRTIHATERLMASPAQAYAMEASMTRGLFQLHPRLRLFPLDVPNGSRPVCEVPIIDRRVRKGTFPVEVKGTPRASGRVVARAADGEILWPSGRALLR
jgi:hypothetical protein